MTKKDILILFSLFLFITPISTIIINNSIINREEFYEPYAIEKSNIVHNYDIKIENPTISSNPAVNKSITISKSFSTTLERDYFNRNSFYAHTHKVSATFSIIGHNTTVTINVTKNDRITRYKGSSPGFEEVKAIDSMKIILKYKSDDSLTEIPITQSNSINVSYYENYHFQFYFHYSYSYVSCSSSSGHTCYETTVSTASGEKYSEFVDFQTKSESGSFIDGYNIITVFIAFTGVSLIILTIINKKLK